MIRLRLIGWCIADLGVLCGGARAVWLLWPLDELIATGTALIFVAAVAAVGIVRDDRT